MGVVRSHWKVVASISSIVAVVLVQTLSVLLVTSVANGFTRTAVFVTSLPLVTVLICVRRVCRGRSRWTIVALSTAVSVGVIHLLRGIDSSWFLGPLPAGYDLAAYAMVGGITLAVAAAVVTAFSSQGRMRKARWVVLGLVATLLVSFGLLVRSVLWEPSPTDLLRTVAHLEQADKQLSRVPLPMPSMTLNPEVKDIFGFQYEDFTLSNYRSHDAIKAPIAV